MRPRGRRRARAPRDPEGPPRGPASRRAPIWRRSSRAPGARGERERRVDSRRARGSGSDMRSRRDATRARPTRIAESGRAAELASLDPASRGLWEATPAEAPHRAAITQNMIGVSPRMHRVFRMIEKVAPTESTVLITGESGTGKEMVATAIHLQSRRAHRPYVTVNAAAVPESLFESELFGHVRGAFTGAVSDKVGLLKRADGGTLFLDEVAEMPLAVQAKL